MLNFIKSGLEDLCVSRTTFTWGVPVPKAPGHVVYVWLDALINYISALGVFSSDQELYGKFGLVMCTSWAKEIVRFPLSSGQLRHGPWAAPSQKVSSATAWWTVEGGENVKSRGMWIDPGEIAAKYSADAVRYFLLREVPFGADGDFSHSAFVARVNSELANDSGQPFNWRNSHRSTNFKRAWCFRLQSQPSTTST